MRDDSGSFSVHLISEGFPQHGIPGPIDTRLGVNLGATVINVPDADVDGAVRRAVPLLLQAQREIGVPITPPTAVAQTLGEAAQIAVAPGRDRASTRHLNGDIDFDSNGDPRLDMYAIRAAAGSRVMGVGEPYLSSEGPSTADLWRS